MLADEVGVTEVLLPIVVGLTATDDGFELEIGEVPDGPVGPLLKVPFEAVGYGIDDGEPESVLELPVPKGNVPVLESGEVPVGPVDPLVKVLFPEVGYGADEDGPETLLEIGEVPVGPAVEVPFEGVGYGTDVDEPESVFELPVPKGTVPVLDGKLPELKVVDVAAPPVPVPSDGRV